MDETVGYSQCRFWLGEKIVPGDDMVLAAEQYRVCLEEKWRAYHVVGRELVRGGRKADLVLDGDDLAVWEIPRSDGLDDDDEDCRAQEKDGRFDRDMISCV